MSEGKYAKIITKRQVGAIFHIQDIQRNVLPKFTELVWRCHVALTLRGTNITARNQQKHLLLSFATKA